MQYLIKPWPYPELIGLLRIHNKEFHSYFLRKPEATNVNGVSGFFKTEEGQTKYNFAPDHVHNVDEIGCTATTKKIGKRLSPTRVK